LTAQVGSEFGVLGGVRVYDRYIDFSQENLAENAHFELFSIPAGAQVLNGTIQILTVDAGGGKINLGVGGTGTELLDSQVLSSQTAAKLTAGGVQATTAADTIDLWAETAAITTAKVRITMQVLCPSDIASM
jgi:hypothetical protein